VLGVKATRGCGRHLACFLAATAPEPLIDLADSAGRIEVNECAVLRIAGDFTMRRSGPRCCRVEWIAAPLIASAAPAVRRPRSRSEPATSAATSVLALPGRTDDLARHRLAGAHGLVARWRLRQIANH